MNWSKQSNFYNKLKVLFEYFFEYIVLNGNSENFCLLEIAQRVNQCG